MFDGDAVRRYVDGRLFARGDGRLFGPFAADHSPAEAHAVRSGRVGLAGR